MSTPNLLYTDVEDELRASVRRLLAARSPATASLRLYDEPTDLRPLWTAVAAELGLAGLLVPELAGGSGASVREAAVVCEEIGRAVAPVPFLTSSVIATTTLLHASDDAVLTALATGERTAVLAVPFTSATPPEEPTVTADETGLTGSVRSVAGLDLADTILVLAQGADGAQLHVVEIGDDRSGVSVTMVASLDMTRQVGDIVFSAAPSRRVATADPRAAVQAGLHAGAAMLASEQVGVAEWCLTSTLDHVKARYQFGRPIGSFQAVKHRLADLWVEVNQAGAAARYAADALARGEDDQVAVAVAVAYCSRIAVLAAEECVQLHGGIGMTWEFPAHLYLKRAKADELALGTPFEHRTRLAGLVNLPPA